MSRCDVEIIHGEKGQAKRVLLNGEPVPGLLRVQTTGGPREGTTVLVTVHATSVQHGIEELAASGD